MRFKRWALAAAALVTAGAAQASWYEASSKHFVVYSDDSQAHVKDYTDRLERFALALKVLHGDASPERGAASRVTVFVLPSVDDVSRLHAHAAGFWVPYVLPVAFMPRRAGEGGNHGLTAQAIMFHEYTHHWMLTAWADAAFPAWYSEGAAEFHATAQVRPDGSVVFGAQPEWRMYGVGNWLKGEMPVPQLLRAVPGKLSDQQSEALYGRGWLLTNYLTLSPDGRKQLFDYIQAINSGKTIDQAAPLLGGVTDGKLDSWAQKGSVPSLVVPADKLPVGTVAVRQLTPGEEAAMPALIRSKAGVSKGTAPQVVAQARRIAAAMPDDPAVNNELAEAEYDAASLGPPEEAAAGYTRAAAAADRALAADPKSIHALVYKGMAAQAQAVTAKKTDAATWAEVRRWYIAANKVDTENPEPLLRFYESFGAARQAPSQGAQNAAVYGYALAPHSIEARMDATEVLLRAGKTAQARIALAPIAYRADAGSSGADLTKVLTAIDTGGAPAGLDALEALKKKNEDAEKKKG